MRALARAAALPAIARLTALANSEDERIALAATQELLNRAFGKIGAASGEDAPPRPLVIKILRFGFAESEPEQAGRQETGVDARGRAETLKEAP